MWEGTYNSLRQIQYITLSTLGNAQDFGEATVLNKTVGTVQSSTRAVVVLAGKEHYCW